jgi:hypothetical protein
VPLLEVLLRDQMATVALAAADNPNCPPYLRALWQLDADSRWTPAR